MPQALVIGDFIADRAGKMEMALLAADGTVSTVRRGELDERPFSIRETQANRTAQFIARQSGKIGAKQKIRQSGASENWTIDDNTNIAVSKYRQVNDYAAPVLLKANLSGRNTDDILFLNAETREIKILSSPEPEKSGDEIISFGSGVRSVYTLEAENQPAAMLSMKLNIFARPGLVILQNGKIEPTFIAAAPTATFNVTKTPDTNDGACNADCSLREAIRAANNAAGADIIVDNDVAAAGRPNRATLVVVAPPTISKTFGAASIPLNGSTSLSFTITNPAANTVSLTGVAFTDTLPAGLVVSTPNGLTGTCGGTITATAGSGSVSLSGATLTTGASCTFSINVTDASGGTRTARTNPFGYFRFTEIPAGETYIISVASKRYTFVPQILNINGDLTDLIFTETDR